MPSFQFQYFRSTVYTTSRLSFNNSCSTFSRFFSLTCYYFLQSLSQTLLSFFFFVLVTHNKHRWYYFPKDRKLFFYYVIFSWSSDFDQYFYLSSHPFFIFFSFFSNLKQMCWKYLVNKAIKIILPSDIFSSLELLKIFRFVNRNSRTNWASIILRKKKWF